MTFLFFFFVVAFAFAFGTESKEERCFELEKINQEICHLAENKLQAYKHNADSWSNEESDYCDLYGLDYSDTGSYSSYGIYRYPSSSWESGFSSSSLDNYGISDYSNCYDDPTSGYYYYSANASSWAWRNNEVDDYGFSYCWGTDVPTGTNWQNYVSSYNGSYSSWSNYDWSDYSNSDYVSYEILSSSETKEFRSMSSSFSDYGAKNYGSHDFGCLYPNYGANSYASQTQYNKENEQKNDDEQILIEILSKCDDLKEQSDGSLEITASDHRQLQNLIKHGFCEIEVTSTTESTTTTMVTSSSFGKTKKQEVENSTVSSTSSKCSSLLIIFLFTIVSFL